MNSHGHFVATLKRRELAEENVYFARRDRELLEQYRRQKAKNAETSAKKLTFTQK